MYYYLIILICYALFEIAYINIASRLRLVYCYDLESFHKKGTVKGGGIIFSVSALFFLSSVSFTNIIFALALIQISVISFISEIKNLNIKVKLLFQSLAIIDLIYAINTTWHWIFLILSFILILGVVNGFNLMGSINGMTVFYSIVTIGTLFWVNNFVQNLQNNIFFFSVIAALSVFSFFSIRKIPECVTGDVGNFSIAFIICFLLFSLILKTKSLYWLFFLFVYGVDVIFTVISRLVRKEILLTSHQSHFYQYLINEKRWGYLKVAFLYAMVQGLLNVVIIYTYINKVPILFFGLLLIIIGMYITFRCVFEGYSRLFIKY